MSNVVIYAVTWFNNIEEEKLFLCDIFMSLANLFYEY